MKFFTPEWLGGELPEGEESGVVIRYAAHIDSLLPKLPATVRTLAQAVNLHDGLIRSVTLDRSHQALEIAFRCGDLQVGYLDLALVYTHLQIRGCGLSELETIAEDPKSEALYDEIDAGMTGAWVHRILFWPYREIQVEFGELGLHLEPKENREFTRRTPVYLERTTETG